MKWLDSSLTTLCTLWDLSKLKIIFLFDFDKKYKAFPACVVLGCLRVHLQ